MTVVLRPRLSFRIGVTGHRLGVDAILAFARDELGRLAALPEAAKAYAAPAPGEPACDLSLVSALAEGADRLVARRAREAGVRLYAPLPFPREAYVADFPATAGAFDRLLAGAQKFELDGAHAGGEAQSESYEAVGRFVVRNCDLLIAVWDGKPARGQGGAESTAEYAARSGVRIWWIHAAEDRPPRFLSSLAEFRIAKSAPEGEAAFAVFSAYLSDTILPVQTPPPRREGAFGILGAALHGYSGPDLTPLEEFYAETPRPLAQLRRLHGPHRPGPRRPCPAEPGRLGVWTELYRACDARSGEYGDRYRFSYVLVAFLVIVALATAAFGGEEDHEWQGLFILAEIAAAEFALLERQSRHMIAVLKTAQEELNALAKGPIGDPQGSLHLGYRLYATTTAMMQDIAGWAHLFRVKMLEAG